MADEPTKIIREISKLMDIDDLMREVRLIQDEAYKRAVDYYAEQYAKTQGKDLTARAGQSARAATLFEKDLFEFISKNKGYNSEIRGYLRSFDTIDTLNKTLQKTTNGIDIKDVLNVAQETKGLIELEVNRKGLPVVKTSKGVVGRIYKNLTGDELRANFTRGVQKVMYDNLLMGTPFSQARENMRAFIKGNEGQLGQLERWSGQITRDALSQYDGFINSMVAEQYDMNAYRYVGSIKTTTRPQCSRWVSKKILDIDTLGKEIKWAYSSGSGMIPGTNVKNFATYRGGYNCRHKAIPTYKEEKPVEEFKEAKTIEEAEMVAKENSVGGVKYQEKMRFGPKTPKFDYSKKSVNFANTINKELNEANKISDRLGIPRIRGVMTTRARVTGQMGDGVLYYSPRHTGEVYSGIGGHKWKFGDSVNDRPSVSGSFFNNPNDSIKNTFWHEYGHHIHQQFKVKDTATLMKPPVENLLKGIKKSELIGASKYATSTQTEWFAENYALFKSGRKDLVDHNFIKFFNENIGEL